jgi:phospholipase/carboxylesterase
MALSAYLPLASRLAADRDPANLATPIFMAHGLADPMLPITMALDSREQLKSLGYSIEWHQYPMAHSLCSEEVADIRHYLFRVLPSP